MRHAGVYLNDPCELQVSLNTEQLIDTPFFMLERKKTSSLKWHYIQANLCLLIFLSLCSKKLVMLKAVRQVFLERLFSWHWSLGSRSCLTCSTLWITSPKLACCQLRSSTTHVTSESFRSGVTAENLSQIWRAHFRSVHRKWMACWWKDDNPICGDEIDKALEKISAGVSDRFVLRSHWKLLSDGVVHECTIFCQ